MQLHEILSFKNYKIMTKKNLLFSLVLTIIISGQVFAQQGVSINEDGELADPSAMLDVKSEDKGILIPRVVLTSLTSASNPVTAPADGLFWTTDLTWAGSAIAFILS